MKISEFAAKYNVSNDTIRYYMKLNLITAEKEGSHYQFDERCEKQLEEILRLKKMNFFLQEIKEIFNIGYSIGGVGISICRGVSSFNWGSESNFNLI